jgi:hypothetical protein
MDGDALLECSFLIPTHHDSRVSDGAEQSPNSWKWLESNLLTLFEGVTPDRGLLDGFYKDPDSGRIVVDQSYKYTVAVEEGRIGELRKLLAEACGVFRQKSIYLSVAGRVEFIDAQ